MRVRNRVPCRAEQSVALALAVNKTLIGWVDRDGAERSLGAHECGSGFEVVSLLTEAEEDLGLLHALVTGQSVD